MEQKETRAQQPHVKVLVVPLAANLLPHPNRARSERENADFVDGHVSGQRHYASIAAQTFDRVVATFASLGAPVHEMDLTNLIITLGDATVRTSYHGQIIVCRDANEVYLEQLHSWLKSRDVKDIEVSLFLTDNAGRNPQTVSLASLFEDEEEAEADTGGQGSATDQLTEAVNS